MTSWFSIGGRFDGRIGTQIDSERRAKKTHQGLAKGSLIPSIDFQIRCDVRGVLPNRHKAGLSHFGLCGKSKGVVVDVISCSSSLSAFFFCSSAEILILSILRDTSNSAISTQLIARPVRPASIGTGLRSSLPM